MFYKLYHLTFTLTPYSSSFILNQKGKCGLDLLSNWGFEHLNSDYLGPSHAKCAVKISHQPKLLFNDTVSLSGEQKEELALV